MFFFFLCQTVPRNDTDVTQGHMVTSCPSFPETSTQQELTFSSTAAPTALQVTRTTNMVSSVSGVISKQLGRTSVLMSFLKELPTRLPSAAMATPQLTGPSKTTFFSGSASSNPLGKTTFASPSSYTTADSIGVTAKGKFRRQKKGNCWPFPLSCVKFCATRCSKRIRKRIRIIGGKETA